MGIREKRQSFTNRPIILIQFELMNSLTNILYVNRYQDCLLLVNIILHLSHKLIMMFFLKEYPELL